MEKQSTVKSLAPTFTPTIYEESEKLQHNFLYYFEAALFQSGHLEK